MFFFFFCYEKAFSVFPGELKKLLADLVLKNLRTLDEKLRALEHSTDEEDQFDC